MLFDNVEAMYIGSNPVEKVMRGSVQSWIFAYIILPTLTVQGSPTSIPRSPNLTSSAFAVEGDVDTHIQTDWEIRDGSNTLIWSATGTP